MVYTLNKAQFEFLRKGYKPLSDLVPEIVNVPMSESDLKDLIAKKYLDSNNVINKQLSDIIRVICQPNALQRQRLVNMDTNFEQVLYYRENQNVVCVSDSLEGIKIESDYNNENDLEGIAQFIGSSILKSTAVEEGLSVEEGFVLSAIWDVHRKLGLEQLYSDKTIESISKSDLVEMIELNDSSQCFSFYIEKIAGVNKSTINLEDVLKQLEIKEILKVTDRIELTGKTYEVCLRFPVFNNIMQFSTASNFNGENYGSEIIVIQNGVSDLLMIEMGSESVNFLSVSSLTVISMLEAFYKEPPKYLRSLYETVAPEPIVQEDEAEVPANVSEINDEGPKFCPNCGTKRSPGSKFCGKCGKKF